MNDYGHALKRWATIYFKGFLWSSPFCTNWVVPSIPWLSTNQLFNMGQPKLPPLTPFNLHGPTEAKNANGRGLYVIIKFAPLTCRLAGLTLARSRVSPRPLLSCELTASVAAGTALSAAHIHWEYSSDGRNEGHVTVTQLWLGALLL